MTNYNLIEPEGIIPLRLKRWIKTNGKTVITIFGILIMMLLCAFILSLEGA